MPLLVPARPGALLTEALPTSTSAAGTSVAANATPHTKTATPVQLIASTAADAYGIFVHIDNSATSNATTNTLLDIMRGGSGSETVLIPDLMVGWVLNQAVSNTQRTYFFPIFIPASTRLSARSQSTVASKTALVSVTLLQRPTQLGWVGSRVTAYGVDAAASRGTTMTSGNNAYGTPATVSASTTNPIKFMQLGLDPGTRTTVGDSRVRAAIYLGASTVIADDLQGATDTGTESINYNEANQALGTMMWNFPAGIDLRVATMHNTTGASFSAIVYGVD
jgi:hypothetical protein